jgi:hypothetical protein
VLKPARLKMKRTAATRYETVIKLAGIVMRAQVSLFARVEV